MSEFFSYQLTIYSATSRHTVLYSVRIEGCKRQQVKIPQPSESNGSSWLSGSRRQPVDWQLVVPRLACFVGLWRGAGNGKDEAMIISRLLLSLVRLLQDELQRQQQQPSGN